MDYGGGVDAIGRAGMETGDGRSGVLVSTANAPSAATATTIAAMFNQRRRGRVGAGGFTVPLLGVGLARGLGIGAQDSGFSDGKIFAGAGTSHDIAGA